MADDSYQGKVYRKQGGDEIVVASGGVVKVEAGGSIENEGDLFTSFAVDDVTIEVVEDVVQVKAGGIDTDQLAAGVAAAIALVSAIPTEDPGDSETIWNDEGVLKVAGSGA